MEQMKLCVNVAILYLMVLRCMEVADGYSQILERDLTSTGATASRRMTNVTTTRTENECNTDDICEIAKCSEPNAASLCPGFCGDYGNRNKLRACNQDFGFVIDSSASVKNHWAEQKSFIKKLIEPIVISPSGGRAAVTTFSNQAALLITFSDHTTTAQFEYALDDLPYWGSTTRINLGLEVALEEMFQENNGMRSDEQQTLFLITDGQQTGVDFDEYRQRFNKAGIRIVVIGVGNVRHRDLRHMVNDIGDLYFAKDFDILLSEPFIKSINLCGEERDTFVVRKEPCRDKNLACPRYINHGYARLCAYHWFAGKKGRYGCKKSCGLC